MIGARARSSDHYGIGYSIQIGAHGGIAQVIIVMLLCLWHASYRHVEVKCSAIEGIIYELGKLSSSQSVTSSRAPFEANIRHVVRNLSNSSPIHRFILFDIQVHSCWK